MLLLLLLPLYCSARFDPDLALLFSRLHGSDPYIMYLLQRKGVNVLFVQMDINAVRVTMAASSCDTTLSVWWRARCAQLQARS
jgi:hypothetical protein